MNEYAITLRTDAQEQTVTVLAETAALARAEAEDQGAVEVIAVKFVRALSFSCRIRGSARRG